MKVLDHGIEVEALEFLGVVECLAHRIGQGGMLVKAPKTQLVRPPLAIRPRCGSGMHDRALARALVINFVHVFLRSGGGVKGGKLVRRPEPKSTGRWSRRRASRRLHAPRPRCARQPAPAPPSRRARAAPSREN